jgi:hypothetical protein
VDQWAPQFAVLIGLGREQLLDLSVPAMVDHLDYWTDVKGGSDG